MNTKYNIKKYLYPNINLDDQSDEINDLYNYNMIENNNTHSSNPYSFSTSKFYNNQKQNLDGFDSKMMEKKEE